MKFYSEFKLFLSTKCTWKCRLRQCINQLMLSVAGMLAVVNCHDWFSNWLTPEPITLIGNGIELYCIISGYMHQNTIYISKTLATYYLIWCPCVDQEYLPVIVPALSPVWVSSHVQQETILPFSYTVKPVSNDHLCNKIYGLCLFSNVFLVKTGGSNFLFLTISAFWSSSRWPKWDPKGREVSN